MPDEQRGSSNVIRELCPVCRTEVATIHTAFPVVEHEQLARVLCETCQARISGVILRWEPPPPREDSIPMVEK